MQFFAIRLGRLSDFAILDLHTTGFNGKAPWGIWRFAMRKMIVTAVAAFVLGGATTGVLLAQAQPAPSPMDGERGGMTARGAGMMDRDMGPGGDHWGERMREHHARRMEMMRTFALIHRADDLKLTPPDVQKIAEAFLLRNGNHSWKVLNVAAEGDAIGFDLATGDGSVIARFAMDPKTGHLTRLN